MKSYLRFGDEGPPGDGEAAVDRAEVLSHDGETAPLSAARTGRQPLERRRKERKKKKKRFRTEINNAEGMEMSQGTEQVLKRML